MRLERRSFFTTMSLRTFRRNERCGLQGGHGTVISQLQFRGACSRVLEGFWKEMKLLERLTRDLQFRLVERCASAGSPLDRTMRPSSFLAGPRFQLAGVLVIAEGPACVVSSRGGGPERRPLRGATREHSGSRQANRTHAAHGGGVGACVVCVCVRVRVRACVCVVRERCWTDWVWRREKRARRRAGGVLDGGRLCAASQPCRRRADGLARVPGGDAVRTCIARGSCVVGGGRWMVHCCVLRAACSSACCAQGAVVMPERSVGGGRTAQPNTKPVGVGASGWISE
jgi:hypothetical protein